MSWEDNDHAKHFIRVIGQFREHAPWQVYTDFLRLATDAFLSDKSPDNPREQDYLQTMGKYSKADTHRFGLLLADVVAYMHETNNEILSELWERFAANKDLGQFFTPWGVCILMAEMQMRDYNWEQHTPENPCRISDPSCGAGRTLVAALKQAPAHKLDSLFMHGIDIDLNVCHACALNMMFYNVNSYIVHGNALTMDVWHVFQTIHGGEHGGYMVEITDPEMMKRAITMGLNKQQAKE